MTIYVHEWSQLTYLPTVWCRIRTWALSIDLRLGTTCIHWITIGHAVASSRQCLRWACNCHVDYSTNLMYVQNPRTAAILR